MPSFVCDGCQESLRKRELDAHADRCRRACFSCVDCSVTFDDTSYRQHTACMTEAQKYQKSGLDASKRQPEPIEKKEIISQKKSKESTKKKNKDSSSSEKLLLKALDGKTKATLRAVTKKMSSASKKRLLRRIILCNQQPWLSLCVDK